jgi:CRISPR/Cas system-associated protein Cas10 (large subunit of type III CRISPR-Cas system)
MSENKSKYLYGASVQGIQDFIFKTNRLQEIVGASEIVKGINHKFENKYKNNMSVEILLNAAGNIKAIFTNKDELQQHILNFEKDIMQSAYGITISQVVVVFEGEYAQTDIDELEKKIKIQRNKPSIPLDLSLNITKLNPKTAKPLIADENDKATSQKREAYQQWFKKQKIEEKDFEKSKELSYISNGKNKIAVIHIDGNGLGEIVKKLGKKLSNFSIELNNATIKAVNEAKGELKDFRKVVVGGDDVTVICNANDALTFTKNFLQNFEENTKNIKELKDISDKLTACAGIAYCNEKYPFHYAVSLAEELCSQTKKQAKEINPTLSPFLAPSSLMFHKIQSSNFQSWKKFVKDELTISNDKESIRCDFGAYYLNEESKPQISHLITVIESLRVKESPKSKLRSWLSELYKSSRDAQNFLERVDSMADINPNYKKSILNKNLKALHKDLALNNLIVDNKTPIYDILQILSTTEAK